MTKRQRRVRNQAGDGRHGQAEAALRRAEQTALDSASSLNTQLRQMIEVVSNLVNQQVSAQSNPLPQPSVIESPRVPVAPQQRETPSRRHNRAPHRTFTGRQFPHRVRSRFRDGTQRDRRDAPHTERYPDGIVPVLENLSRVIEQSTAEKNKTTFAEALSALNDLTGCEGQHQLEQYFRKMEAVTDAWSDGRRATLLAACLRENAKVIFKGLPPEHQTSYAALKFHLTEGNGSRDAMRHAAKLNLIGGVQPLQGETVSEFGHRVLQTVKNAAYPGTPQEAIEDTAIVHFLHAFDDECIRNALLIRRDTVPYSELITQASILYESSDEPTVFSRMPGLDGPALPDHCPHPARVGPEQVSEHELSYSPPSVDPSREQIGAMAMQERLFFTPLPRVLTSQPEILPNSPESSPDLSMIREAAGKPKRHITSCNVNDRSTAERSTARAIKSNRPFTALQSSPPCEKAKRPLKEEIGVRVHRVDPHPSSPKRVCVQRASEPTRVCAQRASEPERVSPPQSRASSEIVGRLWRRGRDGPVAKQRPRHSRAGRSRVRPWHNRHRTIDNGLHSASTHRPR